MASPRILKTAYTGAVRSTFEYGASAWASAAKTHPNKLDQVQNIGLRTIITMQTTAEVEPLDTRRNAKLLKLGEKDKRMPDHPLHKRLQDLTKNRLKRTCLNHVLKEQQRKQSDILATRPEEYEMLTLNRTPLVLKAEEAIVKPLSKY